MLRKEMGFLYDIFKRDVKMPNNIEKRIRIINFATMKECVRCT